MQKMHFGLYNVEHKVRKHPSQTWSVYLVGAQLRVWSNVQTISPPANAFAERTRDLPLLASPF